MKTISYSCAVTAAALVALASLVPRSASAQANAVSAPTHIYISVEGQSAPTHIYISIDGQNVPFQNAMPRMFYGRVLVPLSDVVHQLGAVVRWNPRTHTVTVVRDDKTVRIPLGSRLAYANGRPIWMDVPAMTIGGYTMVPLGLFSDAFGAMVSWNDATSTVVIDTATRRHPAVTTVGLEEPSGTNGGNRRASVQQTIGTTGTGADQRDRAQYQNTQRASYTGNLASLDREYIQYLRDQDFRRYLHDVSAWIKDFQDYVQNLVRNGRVASGQTAIDYDQYLRDRDFDQYTNYLPGWQTNFRQFLQWRRTLNPDVGNPGQSDYRSDRDSLIATSRLLLSEAARQRRPATR